MVQELECAQTTSRYRDHKLIPLPKVAQLKKVLVQERELMGALVPEQLMEVLVVMEVQSQMTETR